MVKFGGSVSRTKTIGDRFSRRGGPAPARGRAAAGNLGREQRRGRKEWALAIAGGGGGRRQKRGRGPAEKNRGDRGPGRRSPPSAGTGAGGARDRERGPGRRRTRSQARTEAGAHVKNRKRNSRAGASIIPKQPPPLSTTRICAPHQIQSDAPCQACALVGWGQGSS